MTASRPSRRLELSLVRNTSPRQGTWTGTWMKHSTLGHPVAEGRQLVSVWGDQCARSSWQDPRPQPVWARKGHTGQRNWAGGCPMSRHWTGPAVELLSAPRVSLHHQLPTAQCPEGSPGSSAARVPWAPGSASAAVRVMLVTCTQQLQLSAGGDSHIGSQHSRHPG